MIDSYEEFHKEIGIHLLYRFGIEHTLFVTPEAAKAQMDSGEKLLRRCPGKDDNKKIRELLMKKMGFPVKALLNFHCTHILPVSKYPDLAGALWNIVFSPNVVEAMTDETEGNMSQGEYAADYYALLRGVVWKLYENIIADCTMEAMPSKDDILLQYKTVCEKMGICPEFTCNPVKFSTKSKKTINAIRIVFHSEN